MTRAGINYRTLRFPAPALAGHSWQVIDIVGLDRQADGGTHVASTLEVGRVSVVKTESKGKGNKRIRIEVLDA